MKRKIFTVGLASLLLALGSLVGCSKKGSDEAPTLHYVVADSKAAADGYAVNGLDANGYAAGDAVKFTIAVDKPADREVYKVKYVINKEEYACSYANDAYSFIMPNENVKVFAVLRDVDKYNLQLRGEAKLGLFADVDLYMGTTPVINYVIEPATAADEAKLRIIDKRVQFKAEGPVSIAAKHNGQTLVTQSFNVGFTDHGENALDPLTVSEAVEKCQALPETTDPKDPHPSEESWYVGGVVTKIEENDKSFSNATLVLDGEFEAYRCSFEVGFDRSKIDLGSYVVIHSKLLNYVNSKGTTVYETSGSKDSPSTFVDIDNSTVRYIEVDPARSIQIGTQIPLHYTLRPVGAVPSTTVTYEIGDSTIVSKMGTNNFFGMQIGTTTVTVKCGDVSSSAIKISVVSDPVVGQTPESPIDGATAASICNTLETNVPTDAFYYVRDYVTSVEENDAAFANATCWLGGAFEIYRGSFAEGFDRDNVCVGAYVTVKATLKKYNSTPETDVAYFIGADVSVAKGAYVPEATRAYRLQVGKSQLFEGYIQPLTGNFPATFSSSDETVATVSSKGTMKALSAGSTTIKIRYVDADENVFEASKELIVTEGEPVWPKGEHISNPFDVDDAIAKAEAGGSGDDEYYVKGELTTFTSFASGKANGKMASSDGSKFFTLYNLECSNNLGAELASGVTITFKCHIINHSSGGPENGSNNTGVISVEHPPLTGIELSESSLELAAKKSTTVICSPVPSGAKLGKVTWTTSDATVATVDGGVITGVSVGTATITAKCGEYEDTLEVTILPEGTKTLVTREIPSSLFPKADKAECSAVFAGVKITIQQGGKNNSTSLISVYKDNKITFKVEDGEDIEIRKLEFKDCASGYGGDGFDPAAEGATAGLVTDTEAHTATWTGAADTVICIASNHQVQGKIFMTTYE